MRLWTLLLIILLGFSHTAFSEEMPAVDNSTDTPPGLRDAPASNDTHPVYSADSHWAEDLIVAVAGLIVAAAVIGPIVRAEAPQAVPAAISHEEDPGADRHADSP
jgi:hypothetical protein